MIATVGNYQQTPFVPGVLGATLRNGNMDFTKENWAVTAGLVLVGIWVAAPPSPPESHLLQSWSFLRWVPSGKLSHNYGNIHDFIAG